MTEITPPLMSAGADAAPGIPVGGWLKKLAPLLGLACVTLLFSALRPQTFPTVENFQLVLKQTAVVGTAALGMTMIIISGGIDLSVGSLLAVCTVAVAHLLTRELAPAVAGLASVALGAVVGLLIGVLVTFGRLTPFVVTLGFLGILRGVAKGLAPTDRVSAPPTWLNEMLNVFNPANVLLPWGVWLMLLLALLVAGVLRYTRFGRHVFAVGSNEQTARLCGVGVERTRILVYVTAGALNGVAGVMLFANMKMGNSTVGYGYELSVIAAVVIGGASLAGGEGTVLGSLIGALIMTVVANGCTKVEWLKPWVQEIVTGVIIILAVVLDRLRHRRAE